MSEDRCPDCRSWEEEFYWTHFQYTQFSQCLHSGFEQHLAIPEKFTRNLRKKLPDKVSLKGPGGTALEVCLTEHENALFLGKGWREFVEYHSLAENDVLIFKYNGESCFDVLIFDGQSMCEKASSYFLRKCVHNKHNATESRTKRTRESSIEVPSASRGNVIGGCKGKRSKRNRYTASVPPIISRVAKGKAPRDIKSQAPNGIAKTSQTQSCACPKDVETKDIVHMPLCLSSRGWIPEEHKRNAKRMAQKVVTSDGFVVVMKPTHVSKKCFMYVPQAWMSKHITYLGNQNVVLRIKDKTWKIMFYYGKSSNRGGFTFGWKNFVMDNNIKEHDVCVFEPGRPLDSTIVLEATVFRAVQEMNPAITATQDIVQEMRQATPDAVTQDNAETHVNGQVV